MKTSRESNQNTKYPSFTQNVELKSDENKELKVCMNPLPDQMGNEIVRLEFDESREKQSWRLCCALIGQNVRCQNTVLSLGDQNHTNCQHRLTFSKSANFESFHRPSVEIDFLIFYGPITGVGSPVQCTF